ncbi:MAG: GTPase Era [Candidatus Omnitrophica bacterium]|nr:GTPase Era [Candidatus Omnitrophota bacterium]
MAFKSGFIAIVGKPYVGKSTLLNYLIRRKIAPVSKKPQTTRQIIHGIRTDEDSQMVFVDTPGLHQARDPLGKFMVAGAKKAFGEADLVYCLADPYPPGAEEEAVLKELATLRSPVFLVLNKVDLLQDKQRLLPVLESYHARYPFKELIPVSALHGTQCDVLLAKTKEYLPEGPQYFPPDMVVDQPLDEIAKELIREKVVRFTGQELPYVTAVIVDELSTRDNGLVDVRATIIVEKESQKAILIGKGGGKMKQIGQAARLHLENFFGGKVYLNLWVKVVPGWKKDPGRLQTLGYE